MLAGLLADHLRGRRLLALIAVGLGLEAVIMLLARHLVPTQMIGVHGVLAIAVAIAVAIVGGSTAGVIVGGVGGVLFVTLIANAEAREPALYGIPVVALWCALPFAAGAAATSLRRAADEARSLAADAGGRTQALHQAVERLAVSATPEEVARIAVVEGASALGASGAWLALIDAPSSALDYVASTGFAAGWVDKFQAIPLDAPTAATDVVRDGTARFFEDAGAMAVAYPANEDAYRAADVQASAVLPLNRGTVPIGMIAFHWRGRHPFAQAERDLARAFADTTAQALERARLYAEVRGTGRRCSAASCRHSFRRSRSTRSPCGTGSASETLAIGGDWYDVVAAHRGQIGIAVGDVGGKGVEAAAIMGRLRTAMRAYAIEHASPSDVLRHLVEYHAVTRPDVFATVLYAALDRRDRRLRIASLGHPFPLLIRDGRLVPLPARAEAPLGADAEREFRELAVPVQEGDLLLFLTDGVFERPGTSWDDSLQDLAATAAASGRTSVEDLADRLISSINDDASARDDRALVVVRVPARARGGLDAETEARPADEPSHEPTATPRPDDADHGQLVA